MYALFLLCTCDARPLERFNCVVARAGGHVARPHRSPVVAPLSAQHLSVAERLHRDIMMKRAEKTLAALRIQLMYRAARNRTNIRRLVQFTRDMVSARSLEVPHNTVSSWVNDEASNPQPLPAAGGGTTAGVGGIAGLDHASSRCLMAGGSLRSNSVS
jgi:hypothetical protein